jgi:TolA-binding protein
MRRPAAESPPLARMVQVMQRRTARNRIVWAAALAVVLFAVPRPAHAVSKEIIELQTQVQQLLDMVQRLQTTLDTRFGGIQTQVQQTAELTTQMSTSINALQQKINTQSDANGNKIDAVSGQVQSLNDSVDELKTRIAKLNKAMQDLQTQVQSAQQPPAAGMMPGATPSEPVAQPTAPPATGKNSAKNAAGKKTSPPQAAPQVVPEGGQAAPPLKETFQAGVRDYNAARYALATGEFQDVVHYYPMDDLAGSAQYYLGEIAYQKQSYQEAISAYNAVLEGFSGNKMAPAAQLHKGLALLALNKHDAGVRELRTLIQRYPQAPEATRARTKLATLGTTAKPSAAR